MKIVQFLVLALVFLYCSLPSLAHDASTAEHMKLGFEGGIVIGVILGFVSGVILMSYLYKSRLQR